MEYIRQNYLNIWIFIVVLISQQEILSQARVLSSDLITNIRESTSENEIWENVEVSFKTSIRNRRDLTGFDYHIIQIKGSTENTTMELHVTRKSITSSDFKIVFSNSENFLESDVFENVKTECIYSGVIKSETNNGVASISTCGKSGEISGMIMKSDGFLMIEPHPVYVHDFDRSHIPHRIRRSNTVEPESAITEAIDVLHVPKEELEAAVELAIADSKAAAEEKDHPHDKEEVDIMNETSSVSIPLIQAIQEDDDYLIEFETLGRKKGKSKTTTQKPSTVKAKASTTNQQEVEVAVFGDPYFYDEMKIRYPKDTDAKIRDYVLTLITAVDLIYEQKSLGVNLILKLVHLEVLKKWPSTLKKNGKSAKDYLTSFCEYAGAMNKNNALWDHALLLTGSDLKEGGSSATAGLAWAGTMCYRYYSCSVNEALQLGSVYVIAHELGHSMGMDHDGEGTCKSCDSNKFLMSPTTGTGKVTWSTCSSKNLKDFIENGSPDIRGSKSKVPPKCLTTTSRESTEIKYKDGKLPGQKFDTKKQCHLALGKKYTPYISKTAPFNNICSMLYCANSTHATTTHAALEGTECDSGKICRSGACVKS